MPSSWISASPPWIVTARKERPRLLNMSVTAGPTPVLIDHQVGLALKLWAVEEGLYPVGYVGVEGVAEPLQMAHVEEIVSCHFDYGNRGVV